MAHLFCIRGATMSTARWLITQDKQLLNLDHVREVMIEQADAEPDSEHKVVAYGFDSIRPENLWVLYESSAIADCEDYVNRLAEYLDAVNLDNTEGANG